MHLIDLSSLHTLSSYLHLSPFVTVTSFTPVQNIKLHVRTNPFIYFKILPSSPICKHKSQFPNAAPWFSLSPRRTEFDPGPIHVTILSDRMAREGRGGVSPPTSAFSLSVSLHHCSILIILCCSYRKETQAKPGNLRTKQRLFRTAKSIG